MMIGLTLSASGKAYLEATTFGVISPKNSINQVIETDTRAKIIAPLIAIFANNESHSLVAYTDKATLTRLFHIKMVIKTFSERCCLIWRSLCAAL